MNHKKIIQHVTLGIPKGMKNAASISIAFSLDFLIKNENIIFEECKTKKLFEIILSELQALKFGWLTQSKKSCHGQTLINECSIVD